jgi:hypothetical protein
MKSNFQESQLCGGLNSIDPLPGWFLLLKTTLLLILLNLICLIACIACN